MRDARADVHTVPVADLVDHDETGFGCWCRPRVLVVCPECDGDAATAEGCWRCGGAGTLPCERPDEYDGPHALIVVHNAADGRA